MTKRKKCLHIEHFKRSITFLGPNTSLDHSYLKLYFLLFQNDRQLNLFKCKIDKLLLVTGSFELKSVSNKFKLCDSEVHKGWYCGFDGPLFLLQDALLVESFGLPPKLQPHWPPV